MTFSRIPKETHACTQELTSKLFYPMVKKRQTGKESRDGRDHNFL